MHATSAPGRLEGVASLLLFVVVVGAWFHDVTLGDATVAAAPHLDFPACDELPPAMRDRIDELARTHGVPLVDPFGPGWIHEANFPLRRRALASGALPFWNPHEGCGNPYFAGYLPGILFPPNWLMHAAAPPRGFDLAYLARLVLAGWTLFLLLRAQGVGRVGAFVGGIAFLASGRIVTGMNLSDISVECLIPALMLTLGRAATRRGVRDVVLGAFVVWCVLAAGNPQAAFLALGFGLSWAAYRGVSGRPSVRVLAGRALRVGGACAIGALLAAPQLVPFLEFVGEAAHAHGDARSNANPSWHGAITWLFPGFFRNVWWGQVLRDSGGFFGQAALAWIVAGVGIVAWRRSPLARFAAVALAVVALCYFGAPGFARLHDLPIFDRIALERYLCGFLALLPAILTGIGADALVRRRDPARSFAIAAVVVLGVVVGYTLLWAGGRLDGIRSGTIDTGRFAPHFGAAPWLALGALVAMGVAALRPRLSRAAGVVALALLVTDVASHRPGGQPPRFDVYREPAFVRALPDPRPASRVYSPDDVLPPNTATIYGLDDIRLRENLVVDRYRRLIRRTLRSRGLYFARPEPDTRCPARALSLLAVRHVFSRGPLEPFSGALPQPGARGRVEARLTPGDYTIVATMRGPEDAVTVWRPRPAEARVVAERAVAGTFAIELAAEAPGLHTLVWVAAPDADGEATIDGVTVGGRAFAPGPGRLRRLGSLRPAPSRAFAVRSPVLLDLPVDATAPIVSLRGRCERGRFALVRTPATTIRWETRGGDGERRARITTDGLVALSVQADVGGALLAIELEPAAFERRSVAGGVRTYENTGALPRVFGVHRAELIAAPERQLERILEPDFAYRETVVLERAPAGLTLPEASPAAAPVIEALREDPAGSWIEVRCRFSAPGLLVVLDNHYPGWRATVDGEPADIVRANYTFRAVAVAAGTHVVRMDYRPTHWPVSLALAALGAIALVVLVTLRKLSLKRDSSGRFRRGQRGRTIGS